MLIFKKNFFKFYLSPIPTDRLHFNVIHWQLIRTELFSTALIMPIGEMTARTGLHAEDHLRTLNVGGAVNLANDRRSARISSVVESPLSTPTEATRLGEQGNLRSKGVPDAPVLATQIFLLLLVYILAEFNHRFCCCCRLFFWLRTPEVLGTSIGALSADHRRTLLQVVVGEVLGLDTTGAVIS